MNDETHKIFLNFYVDLCTQLSIDIKLKSLYYLRLSQSKKEKLGRKLESLSSVNSQPAESQQILESPLLPIALPKVPKHFQSPDFTGLILKDMRFIAL